jgi:hypothetical protein
MATPGMGFANNMSICLVMTLLMGSCSQSKPKNKARVKLWGRLGSVHWRLGFRHTFQQPDPSTTLDHHLNCIVDSLTLVPERVPS